MDPATDAAEQLRRYPLTWTTLGCLFERISLFSLSKIFIERRFIPVLLQSAKDIAKPQKTTANGDDAQSRKRKRDDPAKFDLDYLRAPEALVDSASELFGALSRLLSRLDAATGYADEDAVFGAEHVKLLFRMPGEEARNLVAPLLWICARSLDLLEAGLSEQQEKWIVILMALWDFHLGGSGDSHEFANYLYYPCCVILHKLQDLQEAQREHPISQLWTKQTERLLMKNLVNPARTSFSNGAGLGALELAVEAAQQHASASAQILWGLAVQTRRNSQDPASKKAHLSWTQSVFKMLLTFLEQSKVVTPAVVSMLDLAVQSSCPPDSETLRHICKEYALKTQDTDWSIVADIVECDPDVFLLDESTLDTTFDQITSFQTKDSRSEVIVERIIKPLMGAFSKARDLTGFVKRWHGQLSRLSKNSGDSLTSSPWFDTSIRAECGRLTQDFLSVKQLLGLLDWIQEQDLADGAYLVIFEAICKGITDETYIQTINLRLYRAAFDESLSAKLPTELLALRWRIASATASWVSSEGVHQMWEGIKTSMSEELLKLLTDGHLSGQARDAFDCCAKFVLANYPSGADLAEVEKLACRFLELVEKKYGDDGSLDLVLPYFDTAFTYLPRLQEVTSGSGNKMFDLLGALFRQCQKQTEKPGRDTSTDIHLAGAQRDPEVMDVDYLVGAMVEPAINDLDSPHGACGWDSRRVTALLAIPSEALLKDRRKKIMSSWKKWHKDIATYAVSQPSYAKLVLRLLVQVMRQPTFYTVSYPAHPSRTSR